MCAYRLLAEEGYSRPRTHLKYTAHEYLSFFGSIVYDESRAMVDYQRSNAESRLRNIYRIVVLGTTGAGKTTLARQIAEALDMPHVELDYYRFRPNWVEVPNDEFRERVRKALRGDRWVADGNYGLARDVIWPRVTMLVWLDYPIYVVMWRLFWRTIGRGVLRKELWHGNKEKLWWHFFSRQSLFLWALKTHWRRRRQMAVTDGAA